MIGWILAFAVVALLIWQMAKEHDARREMITSFFDAVREIDNCVWRYVGQGTGDILKHQRTILRNQLVLDRRLRIVQSLTRAIHAHVVDTDDGFGIIITDERRVGDMDRLKFRVKLPPRSAPDVQRRELLVTVGGVDFPVVALGAGDSVSPEFEGDQGQSGSAVLTELDDGNPPNRSEPRQFDFTLVDTFAPPQPGELGIEITGEVHIDDPPPIDDDFDDTEPVTPTDDDL